MSKVSIHNLNEFNALFKQLKQDPNQVRKIRTLFYKQTFSLEKGTRRIPNELLELAQKNLETNFLTLEKRMDSKVDGATKLLFKTHDNHYIEAVILRIATGRVSLCISSQAGCRFACAFCATGTLGFKRNLTVSEICDQVIQAQRILLNEEKTLRNIVFMGMGEPFDNFETVCESIQILSGSESFNFAPNNIMVSTCGLADEMVKFAKLFPNVNMALSLHSVKKECRDEIMPINRAYKVSRLKAALLEIESISDRPVMLEYLIFKDLNNSLEDVQKLINFCKNLNVRINLISYNRTSSEDTFQGVSQDEMFKFKSCLEKKGLTVTIRYSLGEDIAAACGQLAFENCK